MQGYCETTINGRKLTVNYCYCRLALIVVMACVLSGCSLLQKMGILSSPEEPVAPAVIPLSEQPYELELRLSASPDLNPDARLKPSPVQLRIFVMEPIAEVKNTSFEEMFDYAGNEMQPRPLSTLTLRPGQTRDILLPVNKSQSMLVVAAAFRDPYQSLWKAIATLEPADKVTASATIGANTVAINPSP